MSETNNIEGEVHSDATTEEKSAVSDKETKWYV